MKALVEYRAPVIFLVDLDTREIDKVIVLDEEIEFSGRISDDHGTLNQDSPEQRDIRQRAHDIVERSPGWPAWRIGQ